MMMKIILVLFYVNLVECYCDGRSRYIVVQPSSTLPGCNSTSTDYTVCSSLDDVIKEKINLSNTCLYISSATTFALNFDLINVRKFTLTGSPLKCTSRNGILVKNSTDILITSIQFNSCGRVEPLAVFPDTNISSAIFIDGGEQTIFNEVVIFNSFGYGIVSSNPKGDFLLNNTRIRASNEAIVGNFSMLGGLYVDFFENEFNTNVVISNSYFVNNRQLSTDPDCDNEVSGLHPMLPFKKGGGVAIFIRQSVKNKEITIETDTWFLNNAVTYGGGLYLYLSPTSENVKFILRDSFFLKNHAYVGGALFIDNESARNTIHVSGTAFKLNEACVAGALCWKCKYVNATMNRLDRLKFTSNRGAVASAMYTYNCMLSVSSLIVRYNGVPNFMDVLGEGTFYIENSMLHFEDMSCFELNNSTGLVLDNSNVMLYGTLELSRNFGENGGAMTLYGVSVIILKDKSLLDIQNNTAFGKGGGIHVQLPGPQFRPWKHWENYYPCFLKTSSYRHINFFGNKAYLGKDIFASTSQPCTTVNEKGLSEMFMNVNINTEAVKIITDLADWNFQPGHSKMVGVTLLDEFYQSISSVLDVIIENRLTRHKVQNNHINVKVSAKPQSEIPMDLISVSAGFHSKLKTSQCEYGYILNNEKTKCICKYEDSFCHIDFIALPTDTWVHRGEIYSCPTGYCKTCSSENKFIGYRCKYNGGKQCADGRNDSTWLCSGCSTNLSVVFGNSSCLDCRGQSNAKFIIPVVVVVIIFMSVGILFLNRASLSWYMLPTLFFYKNISNNDFLKRDPCLKTFIAIFDTAGLYNDAYGFCFLESLNDLTKSTILISVPFLWFVGLFFQWLVSKCCLDIDSLRRSFVIISFVVMTTSMRCSVMALQSVTIESHQYVRIYAKQHFYRGDHVIIFVFAIIFIIVTVIFVLILASYSIHKYMLHNKRDGNYIAVQYRRIVPVLDGDWNLLNTYIDEENDEKSYLCFYFLAQIFVFAFEFVPFDPTFPATFTTSIPLFFVLVVFVFAQPHRERWHNIFSTIQITLLFLLDFGNARTRWFDFMTNGAVTHYEIVCIAVCYLPLLMCMCTHTKVSSIFVQL